VPATFPGILIALHHSRTRWRGKLAAWSDKAYRPSKRLRDLLDVTRLVEAHPELAMMPQITTSPLRIFAMIGGFVSVQFVVDFHPWRSPPFGIAELILAGGSHFFRGPLAVVIDEFP
jgi:hypothetical protein